MPEPKPEDKKIPPPPPHPKPPDHQIEMLIKEVMDLKEKVGKLEGMLEVLIKIPQTP